MYERRRERCGHERLRWKSKLKHAGRESRASCCILFGCHFRRSFSFNVDIQHSNIHEHHSITCACESLPKSQGLKRPTLRLFLSLSQPSRLVSVWFAIGQISTQHVHHQFHNASRSMHTRASRHDIWLLGSSI
jgi:hypothetical protein